MTGEITRKMLQWSRTMNNNERIYVDKNDFCGDDSCSFVMSDVNDTVEMRYNPDDRGWTNLVRGQISGALQDTGDGVVIKMRGKKKAIKLDYSQIRELQLLLQFYNEDSGLHDYTHTVTKFKQVD